MGLRDTALWIARRIFLREHEFQFSDDETILLRDSVYLKTTFYTDDGPLILTDKRLGFRAHHGRLTGGRPKIDLPLTNIASVSLQRKKKDLLHALAQDSIVVLLKDGKSYEFESAFAETWEKRINEVIAKNVDPLDDSVS